MTFSGKPSPASARSRVDPLGRASARVASNSRAISVVGRACAVSCDRREPRAVQDLVRVGVADAAEEARIGERALERVVLARAARAANAVERRRRAPRGRRGSSARAPLSPRDHVQRRALLRAGLGEHQRAARRSRTRPGRSAAGELRARLAASAAGRRSSGAARGTASPSSAERRCACRAGAAPRRARPSAALERRRRPCAAGTGCASRTPLRARCPSMRARSALDVDRDVRQLGHGAFATSADRLGWRWPSGAGEACQS